MGKPRALNRPDRHLRTARAQARALRPGPGLGLGVAPGVALGVVLGLLAGCGPPPLDFPSDIEWQSAHFDYHARADEAVACASTVDILEQHFAIMQSFLGFAWTAGRKIQYYKFADAADSDRNSLCVRDACEARTGVRSDLAFHEHELIHAYLEYSGLPPSVLVEGIAVVMACDDVDDANPALSWDQAVLSNDPVNQRSIYDTGARWVHHLVSVYGAAPFLQLYAALPPDASPAMVDAAIQRIYGVTADQTWADALAAPPGCLPVWACARDAITTDGAPINAGTQCGYQQDRRTFAVDAASNLMVSTSAGVPFRVRACDEGLDPPPALLPALGFTTSPQRALTQLPAGHYYLDFPNAPSTLAVTIPPTPWAGPDCATLTPLSIAADDYPALRIVPPRGQPNWTVDLKFGGPHLMTLHGDQGTTAATCAGCATDAGSCRTDDAHGFADVLWNGETAVRIDDADPVGAPWAGLDITGR